MEEQPLSFAEQETAGAARKRIFYKRHGRHGKVGMVFATYV